MINKRLQANALQYTLVIGTVVFVLVLTLMLYFHLNSMISFKTENNLQKIQSHQDAFYGNSKEDSPFLIKKNWGAFELAQSSETKQALSNSPFSRIAIMAPKFYDQPLPQLYLDNTSNYFNISGDTRLEGQLKVPYRLIKTGNVAGYIFSGNRILEQKLSLPDKTFPVFNNERSRFEDYMEFNNDSLIDTIPHRLTHSFYKPTVTYFNQGTIELFETELKGNIKVVSETKIVVYNTSEIQDILLIAPIIEIKNGTRMTAHAIARDSIKLQERVSMAFPSSLTIPQNNFSEPQIIISKNVNFSGIICQFSNPKENRFYPHVYIDESVEIQGLVYNRGYTNLSGSVRGSIFTREFLAQERGTLYCNHLINGKIEVPDSKNNFLKLFDTSNKNKTPIKWLY